MKLNDHIPIFQFSEYHETIICASPEHVFEIAYKFDFNKLFISQILLGIRAIPMKILDLLRRSDQKISDSHKMKEMNFIKLAKNPPKELVYGIVEQFWKPRPLIVNVSAKEFKGYRVKGHAKAGWNFLVKQGKDGTIKLSTETRVQCMGSFAKFRFGFYWAIIRPFSGLIRREMLYRIKKDAEISEKN